MDEFSWNDRFEAVFGSCLSCFGHQPIDPSSAQSPTATQHTPLASSLAAGTRSRIGLDSSESGRPLLDQSIHDTNLDVETLSLHSHFGIEGSSRTGKNIRGSTQSKHRSKRVIPPSLTLFGYRFFGRQPIYLPDDEESRYEDPSNKSITTTASGSRSSRSSTIFAADADAAPLDPSTIALLSTSLPEHEFYEQQMRRKAERKQRKMVRRESRAKEVKAPTVGRVSGSDEPQRLRDFEGFQGSISQHFEGFQGNGSATLDPMQGLGPSLNNEDLGGTNRRLHSGTTYADADEEDADLGGNLYTRKTTGSRSTDGSATGSGSASGSHSFLRSHTSASTSASAARDHPPNGHPELTSKSRSSAKSTSSASQTTSLHSPVQSISFSRSPMIMSEDGTPLSPNHMFGLLSSQDVVEHEDGFDHGLSEHISDFTHPYPVDPKSGSRLSTDTSRFPSVGLSGTKDVRIGGITNGGARSADKMGAFLAHRGDA